MNYPLLDHFGMKGTAFLGCRYPIICGAMTWVSDEHMVARIVKNGGFGIIAGGNFPVDMLREEINRTHELAGTSFGVNLITVALFTGLMLSLPQSSRCLM